MDKGRLENIKKNWSSNVQEAWDISGFDIEWLISTVEEQQKEIKRLEVALDKYIYFRGLGDDTIDSLAKGYESQKQENAGLREALGYILAESYEGQLDYFVDVITDAIAGFGLKSEDREQAITALAELDKRIKEG